MFAGVGGDGRVTLRTLERLRELMKSDKGLWSLIWKGTAH